MKSKRYHLATLAVLALAWGEVRSDEFAVETSRQLDGSLPAAHYANAFGCTGGNVSTVAPR